MSGFLMLSKLTFPMFPRGWTRCWFFHVVTRRFAETLSIGGMQLACLRAANEGHRFESEQSRLLFSLPPEWEHLSPVCDFCSVDAKKSSRRHWCHLKRSVIAFQFIAIHSLSIVVGPDRILCIQCTSSIALIPFHWEVLVYINIDRNDNPTIYASYSIPVVVQSYDDNR